MFILFFIMDPWSAKLVKNWNYYEKKLLKKPIIIKHDQIPVSERKLTGGEGKEGEEGKTEFHKKVTKEMFMAAVLKFLNEEITSYGYTSKIILDEQNGFNYYDNKGNNILTVEAQVDHEDNISEKEVKVVFKSNIIEFTLKVEQTRLKDYVKEYVLFYVNKALFAVRQTVFSIHDLQGEFNKMLSYVCDQVGGEYPLVFTKYMGERINQDEGERRLRQISDDYIKRQLKAKPVWGVIKNKFLDLKNKKYTSSKPGVYQHVRRLALKDTGRNARKRSPQERMLKVRGPDHPLFIEPKLTKFFPEALTEGKDHLRIATDANGKIQGNTLRYNIYLSRPNLSDGELIIIYSNKEKPITMEFKTNAVQLMVSVSVHSLRFAIKHGRLALENFTSIMQIVDHLNDLRVWRDFFPGATKYHYRINEFFQPALIQMMYREVFDNMTDGATAMSDLHSGENLSYHFDTSLDMIKWEMEVKEKGHVILRNDIQFMQMGEDFETAYMTATAFIGNDYTELNLGNREVPSESMFNQHFLLKRFMELQVELVVRSSIQFFDYKDDITPFIIEAYSYTDFDEIPAVQRPKPGVPLFGYRYSTEVRNSNKLEPSEFGDRIDFKMCPVLSTEYHDIIEIDDEGYYDYFGGRFYMRKDVDYCYSISNEQKMKLKLLAGEDQKGEEERRLQVVNVKSEEVNRKAEEVLSGSLV